MRIQRESLTSEISQLKGENTQLNKTINVDKEQIRAKESEIVNLNISLLERNKTQRDIQNDLSITMNHKDNELNGIRNKMKQW